MFDGIEKELIAFLEKELPNIDPNKKFEYLLLGKVDGQLRRVVDYGQSKRLFGRLLSKERGKITIYPKAAIKFLQERGVLDDYKGVKPSFTNGVFEFNGIKTKSFTGNQRRLLKFLIPRFPLTVSQEVAQESTKGSLDATIKEIQSEFASSGINKFVRLKTSSRPQKTIKWFAV